MPKGEAIDGGAPLTGGEPMPVVRTAPNPFEREPIQSPIGTGVRAIDAFLTCGRGQRVGIFGGSGVGKSTLMGMMARGTSADSPWWRWSASAAARCASFWKTRSAKPDGALDRRRLHLGPVASAAPARRAIGPLDRRVLRRPRQACAAGAGFHHPLRHGATRDRTGGR